MYRLFVRRVQSLLRKSHFCTLFPYFLGWQLSYIRKIVILFGSAILVFLAIYIMLPIVRIVHRNRRRRDENRRLIINRRNIRENYNPLMLPESRFMELYRASKEIARQLFQDLGPHVRNPTRRGVTIENKILTTLRFYATGSYQRCVGEQYNSGLSQSAVHLYVREVTSAIVRILVPRYIQFPETINERNVIKQEFMEKFGFPGVIGVIDCTHVAILKPSLDEHNFINRKGYHSINCQIVCDLNLKITNLFANYGGSTHDSFIWNHCYLKRYLEANNEHGERGWLIGDSGYPQTDIIMTPFREPADGTPEGRYNNAQIRARNTVERCIGVLKNRFRCLMKERTQRYDPHFVCEYVKACAVLHNICVAANLLLEDAIDEQDNVDNFQIHAHGNRENNGRAARQRIVNQYFA